MTGQAIILQIFCLIDNVPSPLTDASQKYFPVHKMLNYTGRNVYNCRNHGSFISLLSRVLGMGVS